jgi:hypothetical protein
VIAEKVWFARHFFPAEIIDLPDLLQVDWFVADAEEQLI